MTTEELQKLAEAVQMEINATRGSMADDFADAEETGARPDLWEYFVTLTLDQAGQALSALRDLSATRAEVIALRARVAAAEKLAEAAVVTRERLLSHAHDQYDGVWTDEDFAEETAEIDAALAAYEATK